MKYDYLLLSDILREYSEYKKEMIGDGNITPGEADTLKNRFFTGDFREELKVKPRPQRKIWTEYAWSYN